MFESFLTASPEIYWMLFLAILPVLLLIFPDMVRLATFNIAKIDIMSPLIIGAGAVFIGTTLRTFFLLLDENAPDKMLQTMGPFFPDEILLNGLLGINLGIIFWLIGYSFPKIQTHSHTAYAFNETRFKQLIFAASVISIMLNMYYAYKVGVITNFAELGLSAKRMFDIGGDERSTTTFQYLKIGSDIAAATTVAYACYYYRVSHKFRNFIVLAVLFLIAIFVPFIASIRGEIVYLFMSIMIVRHYSFRRVSIKTLLIVFVGVMVILSYLEVLRQQSKLGRDASTFTFEKIIHTLVYTAHFVGVGKTSVIMHQIPQEYDYLHGRSYLSIFIAPIPRVWWPDKPVVRIGQFVGVELMERQTISGVVPGVIGEAYMNFGKPGIALILLIFGIFCKQIYAHFTGRPTDPRSSIFSIGLYAILWVLMLDIFVTDFTGNIVRLLRNLLPFLLIAMLSQKKIMPTRNRVH